ncbi:MAG: ABC transporter substrate-binding protein [Planctomycetota bacterium]
MSEQRKSSDWAFAGKLVAAVLVGAVVLATGWGILVGVLNCWVAPDVPPPEQGAAVVDRLGRRVVVSGNPQRIVAIPPVLPSLIYAVDPNAAANIIGMHPLAQTAARETILSRLVPELMDARTGFVRSGFDVNAEQLLRLQPDLVFHLRQKEEQIRRLSAAGLTVVATESQEPGLENYFVSYLQLLGQCFQRLDRAKMLIADLRSTASEIRSRVEQIPRDRWPRALILWQAERLMATGSGSFADYWLGKTGAINVAAEMDTPPMGRPVSMEQIPPGTRRSST